MAWIELHQSIQRHPKLLRLSAKLRVHRAQSAGHLLFLWLWSLDYAPTGDLSAFGPAEISAAAEYPGDAEIFLQALRETGWMDQDGKLHDWHEYAGRLIEKREADKERKSASRRNPKDVQRTSSGHPPDGARTLPNQPNHTLPSAKDEFWDPLIRIFALDPCTIADEQRLYQQCLDFRLKRASVPEIERRAAIYRLRFPDAAYTPNGLLRQWEGCNEAPGPKPTEPPRKKAQAL